MHLMAGEPLAAAGDHMYLEVLHRQGSGKVLHVPGQPTDTFWRVLP